MPGQNSAALQSKVADLEAEVERLREQLTKAKSVNDVMWDTVVQKVIVGKDKGKSEASTELAGGDDERRRKRGRI